MGIVVVLHNVGSVQRLLDAAKAVFAFNDVELLVVSKPYGAAAQMGVPEAQKMAFKRGKSFMVLPDLGDAVELLRPDKIYTVSWDYGKPAGTLKTRGRIMVIIGATDPGLTRKEALMGEPVYPVSSPAPLGPVAEAAIMLLLLTSRHASS